MAVTTGGKRVKSSFDEGSLDQYLRDISAFPLISREEEVRLAQRIPVRIHIDAVPPGVVLSAGMTATVEIDDRVRAPAK